MHSVNKASYSSMLALQNAEYTLIDIIAVKANLFLECYMSFLNLFHLSG